MEHFVYDIIRHRYRLLSACLATVFVLLASVPGASAQDDNLVRFSFVNEGDDGWYTRGALFRWPGAEFPGPARPDRIVSDEPHIADSAAVVGLGTIQLEQNNVYSREASGGMFMETFTPVVLLRAGVLFDWLELRLGFSYNEQFTSPTPAGIGMHRDGADDLYVGTKIALAEQHGIFPELAIFPQMTVPTGATRFTADDVMPGMVIAAGWEICEGVGLEANTSFDKAVDDVGDSYTDFLQVFNLEVNLTEDLILFNEFIGVWPHGALAAQTEYTYHGGIMYFASDDFAVYVHAATGLNSAADNFFAGIGFSIRNPCCGCY